jgi:hypothetical protein
MKKGSFWGKGVWLIYGGFVVFILGCVAVVAMQHIDLVESDYYEKGLDYQKQIKRIELGSREAPSVAINTNNKSIEIDFNPSVITTDFKGTILFFRPSDSRLDFEIPLKLETSGSQNVLDNRLKSGYWRIKITWQAGHESYYSEHQIFVAG